MLNDKCKKCRRIGDKLFLKGDKCHSPKCTLGRKSYPPGPQAKKNKKGKRGLSEYGLQLRDKQKIKLIYGLREKQFKNYVLSAQKKKSDNISNDLLQLLESRVDNVVLKMGLCSSIAAARQIVSHGHIMVNGRRINIPSYEIKIGDRVSIRPQSVSKNVFKDLDAKLKKYNPPVWMKLDREKKEAEIIAKPMVDEQNLGVNVSLIIGFYSR